ncbi:MAG: PPC domain-containing protein [Methylococcales bacterium]
MRKKLLLTVAVLSVLGIHSSAQALSFEDAKALFDTPVISNEPEIDPNLDEPEPVPVDDSATLPGESEPNNAAASADPIASGVQFTGQLFSGADQDWFRFETTQNNEIVTIETSEANSSWTLTLVDRAGNTIASAVNATSVGERLGTDDPAFRLSVTAERAGTYYLIVRPAPDTVAADGSPITDTFVDAAYRITVTLSDPTNPDNPVLDSNFNDLETEPNNRFQEADPLASGKILLGQLLDGGDEDWFEIQSPGNEIIDIDFCGSGSPCEGQDNRIVMVLKKEFIDREVEANLLNGIFVNHPNLGKIDKNRLSAIEYLGSQGALKNALVGKIHPDFGQQNQLQIGIDQPGTYYFVVAGKLQRDENGAIDTHVTTVDTTREDCGPKFSPDSGEELCVSVTETTVTGGPFVIYEAFNDDQYSIRIRRTNLAPHTPGTDAFAAERARASFDSSTNIIHIPELEFNGAVFEAELIHRNEDDRNIYELLQLRELDQ